MTSTPAASEASQPAELAQAGDVAVFATGLTNPRHVRFGPDGSLYVAEAGVGGDQPATTCPPVDNQFTQDGPYLAGFSGRISRIGPDGSRETVADRLPSTHDGLGDGFGPSDIAWIDACMYAVIEGGGCSRGGSNSPWRWSNAVFSSRPRRARRPEGRTHRRRRRGRTPR